MAPRRDGAQADDDWFEAAAGDTLIADVGGERPVDAVGAAALGLDPAVRRAPRRRAPGERTSARRRGGPRPSRMRRVVGAGVLVVACVVTLTVVAMPPRASQDARGVAEAHKPSASRDSPATSKPIVRRARASKRSAATAARARRIARRARPRVSPRTAPSRAPRVRIAPRPRQSRPTIAVAPSRPPQRPVRAARRSFTPGDLPVPAP